jgi:hypothetical protein
MLFFTASITLNKVVPICRKYYCCHLKDYMQNMAMAAGGE